MGIALESLKFPVGYIQLAKQIIHYQDENLAKDIYQYCGISEEQRLAPEGLINGLQFKKGIELLSEFLQKGDKESLHRIAAQIPLTGHGHLGLAMITAESLAQATAIASTYIHQMVPAFEISLQVKRDLCILPLTRVADFAQYNAIMDELAVMAFCSLMPFSGVKLSQLNILLEHDQLVLLSLHPEIDDMQITLHSGRCAIEFPEAILHNTLTTASQVTHVMMVKKLEERERFLGNQKTLSYRLYQLIKQALVGQSTIDLAVFADQLQIPIRSLSRRLKNEGTSYQHILNDCRMALADKMLLESDISIGQIAFSLGFNNESSFSRIFKQHKGLSPALYRKGQ
jgi:AraC-like DNA-binding protein